MNVVHEGDLWELRGSDWLVIFTNLGWRSDGSNVMGRGIAREANERYPGLAKNYGEVLQSRNHQWGPQEVEQTWEYEPGKLILMPTKPMHTNPSMAWSQSSDPELIRRGVIRLQQAKYSKVWMGMPGCGNGKLDPEDVVKLMYPVLDDRFTVRWPD